MVGFMKMIAFDMKALRQIYAAIGYIIRQTSNLIWNNKIPYIIKPLE